MSKKIVLNKAAGLYGYLKMGHYVRQKLASSRGCKSYRVLKIKPGVKLLICITDKEGPHGGRTKAVAILRDISVDLRHYNKPGKKRIKQAIKKARELKHMEDLAMTKAERLLAFLEGRARRYKAVLKTDIGSIPAGTKVDVREFVNSDGSLDLQLIAPDGTVEHIHLDSSREKEEIFK